MTLKYLGTKVKWKNTSPSTTSAASLGSSDKFEHLFDAQLLLQLSTLALLRVCRLRKLVQMVYSISTLSAIIERLFSESGLLLSKNRRSVKPDSHMYRVRQIRIKTGCIAGCG